MPDSSPSDPSNNARDVSNGGAPTKPSAEGSSPPSLPLRVRTLSPTAAVGLPRRAVGGPTPPSDDVAWVNDFFQAAPRAVESPAAPSASEPIASSDVESSAAPTPVVTAVPDTPATTPLPSALPLAPFPSTTVFPMGRTAPPAPMPPQLASRALPTPGILKPNSQHPANGAAAIDRMQGFVGPGTRPPVAPPPAPTAGPPERIPPRDTKQLINEMTEELLEEHDTPESNPVAEAVTDDVSQAITDVPPAVASNLPRRMTVAMNVDGNLDAPIDDESWVTAGGMFGRTNEQRRIWLSGVLIGAAAVLFINVVWLVGANFSSSETPMPEPSAAVAVRSVAEVPEDSPPMVAARDPIPGPVGPEPLGPEPAPTADEPAQDLKVAVGPEPVSETSEVVAEPVAPAELGVELAPGPEVPPAGPDVAPPGDEPRKGSRDGSAASKRRETGRARVAEPPPPAPAAAPPRVNASAPRETEAVPPPPSAVPPPPPTSSNADDLLAAAKQALAAGNNTEAYRLASQSNGKKRSSQAVRIMAKGACRAKDKVKAKGAFELLPMSMRTGIRDECREYGIRLGV